MNTTFAAWGSQVKSLPEPLQVGAWLCLPIASPSAGASVSSFFSMGLKWGSGKREGKLYRGSPVESSRPALHGVKSTYLQSWRLQDLSVPSMNPASTGTSGTDLPVRTATERGVQWHQGKVAWEYTQAQGREHRQRAGPASQGSWNSVFFPFDYKGNMCSLKRR